MKINLKRPQHWAYLVISGVNVLLTSPFSYLPKKRNNSIVFYDQMNGNSKALSEYLEKSNPEIEQYFLAFPEYHNIYAQSCKNVKRLSPLNIMDMAKVARSDAIITNFGIQTLVFYTYLTKIKFINVWHGVGWKGHSPEEFKFLKRYTETWVTSQKFKEIYSDFFKIDKKQLKITGYARTDSLVNNSYSTDLIRKKVWLIE